MFIVTILRLEDISKKSLYCKLNTAEIRRESAYGRQQSSQLPPYTNTRTKWNYMSELKIKV